MVGRQNYSISLWWAAMLPTLRKVKQDLGLDNSLNNNLDPMTLLLKEMNRKNES